MCDLKRAKDTLYLIFNKTEKLLNIEHIKMFLGLCCLGIKETPDRTGYYRKVIRRTFKGFVCSNAIDYRFRVNIPEEELENIIDYITEKPTVAALVINCEEKIIKFLNPTNEEIEESKPSYILTLNEQYRQ